MSESDIYRTAGGAAGTSGYPSTTAPGASSQRQESQSSTASNVKDATSGVASHVGQAGKDLAHETKDRAGDVAHEAKDRASNLLHQARTEVADQASTQQHRLANSLRSMGSELTQMSGAADQPGYATDLVRQASGVADRMASWLEDREPGDVMREAKHFAQRRPGVFLAIAAGAGLLAGRLLRGAKDAGSGTSCPASRPAHLSTDAAPVRTSAMPAGPAGTVPGDYAVRETDPLTSPASTGLSTPGKTPGTTTGGSGYPPATGGTGHVSGT